MDFEAVIAKHLPSLDVPVYPETEPLTASDLPGNMPLTNRLDKMTCEQARWAIDNSAAWIAYLKANDGEVYQPSAKPVEVSDAEKCQAICDVLENVWLDLTDHMARSYLETHQIPAWVETLQWAIKVLPSAYHSLHKAVKIELETYQQETTENEKEI